MHFHEDTGLLLSYAVATVNTYVRLGDKCFYLQSLAVEAHYLNFPAWKRLLNYPNLKKEAELSSETVSIYQSIRRNTPLKYEYS